MKSAQPEPRILAIETSCDETAISYLVGLKAMSHHVNSQASLHAEYGGVFPNLAKREHTKNLVPVLSLVFKDIFDIELSPSASDSKKISNETEEYVINLLSREHELGPTTISYINSIPSEQFSKAKESLDAIAVTYGPGLEPALWVGISFAKAIAAIFDKPLLPINHMEGHIASVIAETKTSNTVRDVKFPAIALLISGGHTELINISSWHEYAIIGQTVDDAVGEAYDKAARVLGLSYPGGPEISKLADKWRFLKKENPLTVNPFDLPRPMIHSKDFNFSFSGLKTAVLYAVRDRLKETGVTELTSDEKIALAGEFEAAVVEVLVSKTKKAINEHSAESLIIGGGVIANTTIRSAFETLCVDLGISLFLPEKDLSTDNATMIGIVATLQSINGTKGLAANTPEFDELKANGNLSL